MTRKAKAYLFAVILTGLALFALPEWQTGNFPRFLGCLALAVLASTFKIRLPGMEGTYSPSFLVILAVLPALGLAESLAVGCAAATVQSFWKSERTPRDIQVWFNIATVSLSIGAAWEAFRLAISHGAGWMPAACAASASVYYLVNTGLVSGVISLVEKKPLWRVWEQWEFFSLTYYLLGAALTVVLSTLSGSNGLPLMWLSAPAAYGLWLLLRRRVAGAPLSRQQIASA